MSYKTFALVISLSFISASASPAPLSISAEIKPTRTLPGIPVSVLMTVTNEAKKTHRLPRQFVVEVIGSDSGPFLANGGSRAFLVGRVPEVYESSLDLAPAETRTFQIPLGYSIAFPGYLSDPALLVPGTYRLRLIFSEKLQEDGLPSVGFFDRTLPFMETNEMVLEVQRPEGQDAEVLAQLRASYNVATLGSLNATKQIEFAERYAVRFQESSYSPWLAVLAPTRTLAEGFEKILKVLEMNPDPLLADRIRVSLADIQHHLWVQARYEGREKAAAEHFELARKLSAEALRHAQTPLGKLKAIELDQKLKRVELEELEEN